MLQHVDSGIHLKSCKRSGSFLRGTGNRQGGVLSPSRPKTAKTSGNLGSGRVTDGLSSLGCKGGGLPNTRFSVSVYYIIWFIYTFSAPDNR